MKTIEFEVLSPEELAKVWIDYYSGDDIERAAYDEYLCHAQRDHTLRQVSRMLIKISKESGDLTEFIAELKEGLKKSIIKELIE